MYRIASSQPRALGRRQRNVTVRGRGVCFESIVMYSIELTKPLLSVFESAGSGLRTRRSLYQ